MDTRKKLFASEEIKKAEISPTAVKPPPLPPLKWYKRKGVIATILAVALVLYLSHAFMYGWFNTSNCIYTEKNSPVPQELQNTVFKTEKNLYFLQGKYTNDLAHCTASFKNIDKEIMIDDQYKSYYQDYGRSTTLLPSGQTFILKKVVSETKHGMSTIDSGPGPLSYLILEDQQGNLYQMAAVWLGTNYPNEQNMPRFGYYKNGQRIGTLYSNMFEKY